MTHPLTAAITTLTIAALAWLASSAPGASPVLPLICAALVMLAPALDTLLLKRPAAYKGMLRSPVTYLWLAFLALLLIQWLNAGRSPVFDKQLRSWAYAPPGFPGWPSAINKDDALQMLAWFAPAAAISTVLTACRESGLHAQRRLQLLIAPAALLALCSLGQWAATQHNLTGEAPIAYFIWAFRYENHAGAFFLLMLTGALHLLTVPQRAIVQTTHASALHEWKESTKHQKLTQRNLVINGLLAICCLIGANLSFSRAAIILSWILVSIAGALTLKSRWHHWTAPQRVKSCGTAFVIMLCAFFLTHGLFHQEMNKEMATLARKGNEGIIHQLLNSGVIRGRQLLRETTYDLWQQAPWFGHGGWAGRYLIPLQANSGYKWGTGAANTHCDPLQLLSEFGLVGFALLAALCALAIRKANPSSALTVGLITLLLYSLIDLPFRHPAIIATWFALAAAYPKDKRTKSPPRLTSPSL